MKFCRLLLVLLLTACASGAAFQKDPVPEGKAMVYVYRASTMRGALLVLSVVINNSNAIQTSVGSHYAYTASPGEVTVVAFHTGRSTVKLDARPGETYYVRVSTQGFGIPLAEIVSAEEAVPELAGSKRNPAVPGG